MSYRKRYELDAVSCVSMGRYAAATLPYIPPPETAITGKIYNMWRRFEAGVTEPVVGSVVTARGIEGAVSADGSFKILIPEEFDNGTVILVTASAAGFAEVTKSAVCRGNSATVNFLLRGIHCYTR